MQSQILQARPQADRGQLHRCEARSPSPHRLVRWCWCVQQELKATQIGTTLPPGVARPLARWSSACSDTPAGPACSRGAGPLHRAAPAPTHTTVEWRLDTWGWEVERSPLPPGSSVVEVELIPQGDGTLVRLTHRDLPPGEVPAHQAGWSHYLDRPAVRASGGDPGPDPLRLDP
jgi:hypothetical protein